MLLDTVFACIHLVAILSWVVFLSSTAALARSEWLNAASLARLGVVDRVAFIAGWLVLASGLARVWASPKGASWLLGQPLLWAKAALVALMLAAAWRTHAQVRAWLAGSRAGGGLPSVDEVAALRRRVMRASHLMLVLPVLGVLLTRGFLTR
jgi:putative membrane protein